MLAEVLHKLRVIHSAAAGPESIQKRILSMITSAIPPQDSRPFITGEVAGLGFFADLSLFVDGGRLLLGARVTLRSSASRSGLQKDQSPGPAGVFMPLRK